MQLALALFACVLASVSASEFIVFPVCEPGSNYYLEHPRYCDRYLTCVDGFIHEGQCMDGMAYKPDDTCVYSHLVDCTSRPYFQAPQQVNSVCPHLYGLFPDTARGCNYYYECANGVATSNFCVKGLMFDAEKRECRQPTREEYDFCFAPKPEVTTPQPLTSTPTVHRPTFVVPQVTTPHHVSTTAVPTVTALIEPLDIEGFRCPSNVVYPYGDHARYPYPGKCRFFVMCWKDGHVTVGGCEEGMAFNDRTFTCEPYAKVPGCNFELQATEEQQV